jgi:hypothetical protein
VSLFRPAITKLIKKGPNLSNFYGVLPGLPTSGLIKYSDFSGISHSNQRRYGSIRWHRNDLNFVQPSTSAIFFDRSNVDAAALIQDILSSNIDRIYLDTSTGSGSNGTHFVLWAPSDYDWNPGYWMARGTPIDSSLQGSNARFFINTNFNAPAYAYKYNSNYPAVLYTSR